MELLTLIVKENIKLPIVIQMRPDTRISSDPEILQLMKKAGIFLVGVGIEFLEDSSLEEINKGANSQQVIEFVKNMRRWNFSFYAMFIIGGVLEERDNSHKILDFMRHHLPYENMQLMPLTPFPGTKLYGSSG